MHPRQHPLFPILSSYGDHSESGVGSITELEYAIRRHQEFSGNFVGIGSGLAPH